MRIFLVSFLLECAIFLLFILVDYSCFSKKSVVVMPDTQKILENMDEQIKMARLRRNLSTELVAKDDEYGRGIQELNLVIPKRARKKAYF